MKNKKDDNKKNTSGYSENQRKDYQAMYESAARKANKKYPDALKPNSPAAAKEARKLYIKQDYDKAAAELASKRNYGDSDVGSVQSDVFSRNQRLGDRARQRINSPVKGVPAAKAAAAKKEALKRMIPKKGKR